MIPRLGVAGVCARAARPEPDQDATGFAKAAVEIIHDDLARYMHFEGTRLVACTPWTLGRDAIGLQARIACRRLYLAQELRPCATPSPASVTPALSRILGAVLRVMTD